MIFVLLSEVFHDEINLEVFRQSSVSVRQLQLAGQHDMDSLYFYNSIFLSSKYSNIYTLVFITTNKQYTTRFIKFTLVSQVSARMWTRIICTNFDTLTNYNQKLRRANQIKFVTDIRLIELTGTVRVTDCSLVLQKGFFSFLRLALKPTFSLNQLSIPKHSSDL